jgi:hypothetical protein
MSDQQDAKNNEEKIYNCQSGRASSSIEELDEHNHKAH